MQRQYPLRLPVDRVGTMDRLVFQRLFARFGVAESDIERWGGALIPAMNYDEQFALYARGEVNALWQFMGIPSPSIQAAHALRPLHMLPFPPSSSFSSSRRTPEVSDGAEPRSGSLTTVRLGNQVGLIRG